MKYLSKKKTAILLTVSFLAVLGIYALPVLLESLLLHKIIWWSYIALGTGLGVAFLLVNGASTAIIDGEYEKKFYKLLKEGKAENEGQNFHWNPLNLSLAKRIYYSKLILCFLVPVVAVFFIDYVYMLLTYFE